MIYSSSNFLRLPLLIPLGTLAGCNTGVIDSTVPPEDPSQKEEKVKPAEWATVYGVVSCEGKGIKGAVVSDGCKVVLTDGNGVRLFLDHCSGRFEWTQNSSRIHGTGKITS